MNEKIDQPSDLVQNASNGDNAQRMETIIYRSMKLQLQISLLQGNL